ncbi:hypothetical protein CapIbe_003749 [Capra ibex]
MKQHEVFTFRSHQEHTVIETDHISSLFKKKKKIEYENVKNKEKILEASIGKSSSPTKEPEPKAIRVFTGYSRFQCGGLFESTHWLGRSKTWPRLSEIGLLITPPHENIHPPDASQSWLPRT